MNTRIAILAGGCFLLLFGGCTSEDPVPVEYYQPAYRTSPPEPVYSRVMWSHLPNPIKPRSRDDAPFYLPVVSFELPDTTLDEAIEALAQTMGYRWHYPKSVAKRPLHIRMEGTVEEILNEISKQANVKAAFDHEHRMVRVIEGSMVPDLPGS